MLTFTNCLRWWVTKLRICWQSLSLRLPIEGAIFPPSGTSFAFCFVCSHLTNLSWKIDVWIIRLSVKSGNMKTKCNGWIILPVQKHFTNQKLATVRVSFAFIIGHVYSIFFSLRQKHLYDKTCILKSHFVYNYKGCVFWVIINILSMNF